MTPEQELSLYMKEAGKRLEAGPPECLTEAELIGYCEETLEAAAREKVQSHVMQCGRCREALLDAREFLKPAPPPKEVHQEWRALWRRIDPGRKPWAQIWFQPAFAIAASLAVTFGVLWAWSAWRSAGLHSLAAALEERNRELEKKLGVQTAELRAPVLNTLIYDVYSTAAVSRRQGSVGVTRIPLPDGGPVTLVLGAEGIAAEADYALQITDEGGRTVWRGEGLRRDRFAKFVVTLSRGFVRAGKYRFQVFARGNEDSAALAEYDIELTASP
jgi:hypothetical protein